KTDKPKGRYFIRTTLPAPTGGRAPVGYLHYNSKGRIHIPMLENRPSYPPDLSPKRPANESSPVLSHLDLSAGGYHSVYVRKIKHSSRLEPYGKNDGHPARANDRAARETNGHPFEKGVQTDWRG